MVSTKKGSSPKKNNKILYVAGAILAIIALFLTFNGGFGKEEVSASGNGDLTIPKSEVSAKVTFYPYKVGKTQMEVLALKAPDGTIRTAFNTCQVCYDSGRGYYKQEGNVLVCQNCGNRFQASQVEKEKGGCNPVPIFKEDKKDDGTNIVIPQKFLEENKALFGNWKKS
jgi:hypothetical protein